MYVNLLFAKTNRNVDSPCFRTFSAKSKTFPPLYIWGQVLCVTVVFAPSTSWYTYLCFFEIPKYPTIILSGMGELVLHHIAPLGRWFPLLPILCMQKREGTFAPRESNQSPDSVLDMFGWHNSIEQWSKLVYGKDGAMVLTVKSISKENGSLWNDLYKVLANAQLMAFLLDLVKFTSIKHDFCCYPITVHCLSYHSLLHYASPKCTTFGWQAPNTLSYTTNMSMYCILYEKMYQYAVYYCHTFYILTPSHPEHPSSAPWASLTPVTGS